MIINVRKLKKSVVFRWLFTLVMVLLSAAGAASSFTPQAASDATAAKEAMTAVIFLRFTFESSLCQHSDPPAFHIRFWHRARRASKSRPYTRHVTKSPCP